MAYDLYDFTESLERAGLPVLAVERCSLAFGRSPEGYASWEGGFVLLLRTGEWAFLHGWCDTTGWGCQDGAALDRFDHEPTPDDLHAAWTAAWSYQERAPIDDADVDPADLGRFLRGELDRWGSPVSPSA